VTAGSHEALLVIMSFPLVSARSPKGAQDPAVSGNSPLVLAITRMTAMTWLGSPAPSATPPAVIVMFTLLVPLAVQLSTPGSLLTQPFAPTGTNTSIPGSCVAQVESVQAKV
jgi:hypothetical protein